MLHPDCGFAPSVQNPMDLDEAYEKLKVMCLAADGSASGTRSAGTGPLGIAGARGKVRRVISRSGARLIGVGRREAALTARAMPTRLATDCRAGTAVPHPESSKNGGRRDVRACLGALRRCPVLLGSAGPPGRWRRSRRGPLKIALLRDPTGWDSTSTTVNKPLHLPGEHPPGAPPLLARRALPSSGRRPLGRRRNPTTYVRAPPEGRPLLNSRGPVTADDVKWNIERIMAPATNATRSRSSRSSRPSTVVDRPPSGSCSR